MRIPHPEAIYYFDEATLDFFSAGLLSYNNITTMYKCLINIEMRVCATRTTVSTKTI